MRTRRVLGGAVAAVAIAAAPPPAVAQVPPPPVCADAVFPCKLSTGLNEATVIDQVFAPNNERVVFQHRAGTGPVEVYSATVNGDGFPRRLSVASTQAAHIVAVSPDSTRVLYTLPAASDPTRTELFSVPLAGPASASVRIASDISTVTAARISPDSRKVVFAPPARDRLRVVPLAGPPSAAQRLTDPFVPDGRVGQARISANSASVVYSADQDTAGEIRLYRVPLTLAPAPDPPTSGLSGPLAAGGDVAQFALAPDNGPAVYLADQDTDGVDELYSVRLGGADRTKLNRPLPTGWDVQSPDEELGDEDVPGRIVPNGGRVVYEIGRVLEGRVFKEFYSVPIGGPGGASVRLDHPPLIPPGEVHALRYRISPDSGRVVYTLVDQSLPGEPSLPPHTLISVPATGPASAGRVLTFPSTELLIHAISPDSRRVVFRYPGTHDHLYSVPIGAGTTAHLNGSENVEAFVRINATSTRVVYVARVGTERAMFSAPLDGDGTRYNLTQSLDDTWSVIGRALTPNGGRVLYTIRRGPPDAPVELFSSRVVPGIVDPPVPPPVR